jgi:hypothetical protein
VIHPSETVALVGQPSAVPGPEDPGGRGEDFGKSSPVGFLVLIVFFIAVAFLMRSMTKHLKRVPPSFDPPEQPRDGNHEKDARPNGKPEPA